MPVARLTSKGQITIPKMVRERLHLNTGDQLEFVIEDSGEVQVRPLRRSVRKLYGLIRRREVKPQELKEIDEALLDAVSEDDRRIRRRER